MEEDALIPSWTQHLPPKFSARPGSTSSQSLSKGKIPLPELSGDLSLEVFTYGSITQASPQTNTAWGDKPRLAILGEQVMHLIVTWCLFSKRPMLQAQEIVQARDEFLSDANVHSWTSTYGIRSKVRVTQDKLSSLEAPKESRILFTSFVGAVYFEHGMKTCQNFISYLLDPDTKPPPQPKDSAVSVELPSYSSTIWSRQPAPPPEFPPQPPMPPPPVPAPESTPSIADSSTMTGTSDGDAPQPQPPLPSSYPQSAASSIPTTAFLPLFNQTAHQRRLVVDYPAVFSGPAHAGQWHVKCTVNGAIKGQGAAASKQLAKEEAARQAYFAMGWDARPGSMNYPGSVSYPSRAPSEYQSPPPDQQDVDMNGSSSSYGGSSYSGQTPPAPMSYNRTTGPQSYPGNYPATAPPQTTYLPLFNQTATQRRLVVDYPAEFSGPAHAGRWTVRCTVNGVVKGQGQGISKQLAKEDAAKQAWFAMGWGPGPRH